MSWIEWTQRLAAIAQSGLTYARDPFDIERYEALRKLAADVVSEHSGRPALDIDAFFGQEVGYATPKIDVRGVPESAFPAMVKMLPGKLAMDQKIELAQDGKGDGSFRKEFPNAPTLA